MLAVAVIVNEVVVLVEVTVIVEIVVLVEVVLLDVADVFVGFTEDGKVPIIQSLFQFAEKAKVSSSNGRKIEEEILRIKFIENCSILCRLKGQSIK